MLLWQLLVLCAHLITLTQAQSISPWIWVRTDSRKRCEDGKCYFISDKKATWRTALATCQDHGLCLACLDCNGSLNQISKYFKNHRIRDVFWIGLTSYSFKFVYSACTNQTADQISPANKVNPKKPFGTVKFNNNNELIIGSSSSKQEKRFLCAQEDECFGHFGRASGDLKADNGKGNNNKKDNDKTKDKTKNTGKNQDNDLKAPVVIKCDCNNGTDYNINSRSAWTVPKSPTLKYVLGANSEQPIISQRSRNHTYVVNCVCTKNNNNVNVKLNEIKKKGRATEADVAKIIAELAGLVKRTDVKKYSCEA